MSIDVAAIVERARVASADARKDGETSVTDRERVKKIAAEFESMLLVQMLRDMRKAGSWDEGEEGDTLGAQSLFETIDVELASHLSRVKGMGLQDQLLVAFDRMQPGRAPVTPTPQSAPVTAPRESAPVTPTTESAPVAVTPVVAAAKCMSQQGRACVR